MRKQLLSSYSKLVVKYAGWVSTIGIIATLVLSVFAVKIYANLRPDIEELLPTTARAVVDIDEVTNRLRSTESLALLLFSQDVKGSRRFVDDLVARLNSEIPKRLMSNAEYRIADEIQFFKARRALYMNLEDLKRIQSFIKDRIQWEKEIRNPLNIFMSTELPEPILDYVGIANKYTGKVSTYTRFKDGYYSNADETIRAIVCNYAGKISGIDAAKELRSRVDQIIAELLEAPGKYPADLEIRFTGGVQNMIEEQDALLEDLELSTVIVTLLVTIVMLIYFRSFRATLALLASLFMGTIWTFGVAYFQIGYLNANSAFLGAIVIGNGINFGIVFLARYMEERRKSQSNMTSHIRAIDAAMNTTATATWTAALAAGLSYGSLMFTSFRGFNQFGIIGLTGMIICWISAYTLLPAFLTLSVRWRPMTRRSWQNTESPLSNALARWISQKATWIFAATILLTLASFVAIASRSEGILETDLSKLRDKRSMTEGSGYLTKYLDEIFERDLNPTVILPKTNEAAIEIAKRLQKKRKLGQSNQGEEGLISRIQTLEDFVPPQQDEKIRILKDIRKRLFPTLILKVPKEEQKLARDLLNPLALKRILPTDLPKLIQDKLSEKDGSVGKLVLVDPRMDSEFWPGETLNEFIDGLREVADSVDPGSPVAGQLPVTSDMYKTVRKDGPKATLLAFLAVIALAFILFRSVKTAGLVLFALILGVTWMTGLMFGLNLKINFLNFIALPITFGIGIDYGVNIYQRYRIEGHQNIIEVIKQTGGAVGLASLTTIIGFGSLLIAGNQAFVSFGKLAVIGEITCVTAALIALPAFLAFRERRASK